MNTYATLSIVGTAPILTLTLPTVLAGDVTAFEMTLVVGLLFEPAIISSVGGFFLGENVFDN